METSLILNPYFKNLPNLEDIATPLLPTFGCVERILRGYEFWFRADNNACDDMVSGLIYGAKYEDLKDVNRNIAKAFTHLTYWIKKAEYLLSKFPETERYYRNLDEKDIKDAKECFFETYFLNSIEEA